jgi:predicted TIM-barrel fold metal-dependent hydrolase
VDRSRLRYPWLADVPALDRDWTYDAYETTARRLGITGVLHMEVDVAEADIDAETAMVRDLMARDQSLMRGAISAARPGADGFAAWLDGVDRTVVRGIRRVLHVLPDDTSQDAGFRADVRRIGEAGLPFDLCVLARQLPLAAALADACPDTVFVLDHCGVPDIAGGGYEAWAVAIRDLAHRPHVMAKLSGITAYTGGGWTLETLRPYAEHVIDSFGWDRMVWGSDSPVCTLESSLDQWVAVTHALLAGSSEDERRALLSGNALRIWGLDAA